MYVLKRSYFMTLGYYALCGTYILKLDERISTVTLTAARWWVVTTLQTLGWQIGGWSRWRRTLFCM